MNVSKIRLPLKIAFLSAAIVFTALSTVTYAESNPTELQNNAQQVQTDSETLLGTPAEATPVEATPVEATPVEATPVEATPVEATPVEVPAATLNLPINSEASTNQPKKNLSGSKTPISTYLAIALIIGIYVVFVIVHVLIEKFFEKTILSSSISAEPDGIIIFKNYERMEPMGKAIAAPLLVMTLGGILFYLLTLKEFGVNPVLIVFIILTLYIWSVFRMTMVRSGLRYNAVEKMIELPGVFRREKVPIESIRGVQLDGKSITKTEAKRDADGVIHVTENVETIATLIIMTYKTPVKITFSSTLYGDNFSLLANACYELIARASILKS
jgi:hypothetical protein